MDLERCLCCLKYEIDDKITTNTFWYNHVNKKKIHLFTLCPECNANHAIPNFVANDYQKSIIDGKTELEENILSKIKTQFQNKYITLQEYFKIQNH